MQKINRRWVSLVLVFMLLMPVMGVMAQEATEEPVIETVELPEVDPLSVTGDIITAGSSTVFPLSTRMAERFEEEGYAGAITVDSIGTGAGFERFCVNAETDIANASRAIKEDEITACQENGREPIEFRVGTDALAIVVSAENDFVDGLTLDQLGRIFGGEYTTWDQVNPDWPANPIVLFSPGTDSGTFDYFVEVVMQGYAEDVLGVVNDEATEDNEIAVAAETALLGVEGTQFSENDNVLVEGVQGDPNAIGYFGFAYYEENADVIRVIPVEGIEPNETTAESGEYPLARPLFIYSDATVMQEKPQVAAFINFYLTSVNDEILSVGYFPASDEALNLARQNWLAAMGLAE
ncbi:MAG: PstS family phosphate ABC transporter substrate-binding protein [Anaerolineae bacterium]|nr:PstS family phosphate ABC transporter substrate-binding protein [Anaerolineae bacterium]